MKKEILVLVAFAFIIMNATGQDIKVGVRLNPLNSAYFMDNATMHEPDVFEQYKYTSQYDSMTVGIFVEKYFPKYGFLLRLDMDYADLKISQTGNDNYTSNSQNGISDYKQVQEQKFYHINPGIGSHAVWNKFVFTFGFSVPLTILPKSKVIRIIKEYTSGSLEDSTNCAGTFKSSLAIGAGCFGGISVILFKHISVGIDISYQIQYLSRKFDWYGETNYLTGNPGIYTDNESITTKSYCTSKLIPSIVIAYAFDIKKRRPNGPGLY